MRDARQLSPEVAARADDALRRSEAFHALPAAQRAGVAADLREVLRLLSDGPVAPAPRARALADTPTDAVGRSGAVFGQMVDKVDFVAFVGGLMDGVFDSIVASTTAQMTQFATLLESVVKSTKDFAATEVQPADARNMLLQSMPSLLTLDDKGGLVKASGAGDDDLFKQLGAMGMTAPDPSSSTLEAGLVDQARLKIAQQRQQLLATMVLMGINRIVVTDGEINAKVVFDVSAKDSGSRSGQSTGSQQAASRTQSNSMKMVTIWTGPNFTGASQQMGPGDYDLGRFRIGNDTMQSIQVPDGWRVTLYTDWHFSGPAIDVDRSMNLPPGWGDRVSSLRIYGMDTIGSNTTISVQTLDTTSQSRSEDWINAQANLTGEVSLRFKSEVMPLEKFAPDAEADLSRKASADVSASGTVV